MSNMKMVSWVKKHCKFAAEQKPLGMQRPSPIKLEPSSKNVQVHNMDSRIDEFHRGLRSKMPKFQNEVDLFNLIRSLPSQQLSLSLARSILTLRELVDYIRDPNFPTLKFIFEQKFGGMPMEQVVDLLKRLNEFVEEIGRFGAELDQTIKTQKSVPASSSQSPAQAPVQPLRDAPNGLRPLHSLNETGTNDATELHSPSRSK